MGNRRIHVRWDSLAWIICGLLGLGGFPTAVAQELIPILGFTNVWLYEVSGTNLGTDWRQADYDDSVWPLGPGLLQNAETTEYPAPFNTALSVAQGTITCYFRTRFVLPEAVNAAPLHAVKLFTTNLVDDGCVIYLNGAAAGRIRVPNSQTYLTTASAPPASEGQLDVLELDASNLRMGENVVAVEVHQFSATGGDLVWGSHWVAQIASPLSIVREPVGVTNLVGTSASVSVEVSGGPAVYQWHKNGIKIAGAVNADLALPAVSTNSGDYFAIITNSLGAVTSTVARVWFAPDRTGPIPLRAIVSRSNLVDVVFNDFVLGPSVDVTKFSLTRVRNGASIPLASAFSSQSTVRIRLNPSEDWVYWDDYSITLTGIQDNEGNTMAPGSVMPVAWHTTNVIGTLNPWRYHNSALFDPGVYDNQWYGTNYRTTSSWGAGAGVFYRFPMPVETCFGSLNTEVRFQPEPMLFRKTFVLPTNITTLGTLTINFVIDDGAVFYFNGEEILRYYVLPGPITAQTRSFAGVGLPACVTRSITVSNFFPGTNWLAAAVVGSPGSDSDVCFGMNMEVAYETLPSLPAQLPPTLTLSPAGPGLLAASWTGGGYALESAANLDSGTLYPWGPWTEVTNMANPYVFTSTNEPWRFLRLRKK